VTKTYATPEAFKVALEARLKNSAKSRSVSVSVNRVRQRFVMERFLARVVHVFGSTATLKGGLALELRIATARSTKDIDLRAVGDASEVLPKLKRAAAVDVGDHLSFRVAEHPQHPDIEDALYEGRRFHVAAQLATRPYGDAFGVDVSMGDPMHGPTESFDGEDFLAFVGVPPVRVDLYPAETHVAEKFHAYTKPPRRPGAVNSRMKDLPDIAILGSVRAFDAQHLRSAIALTFNARATHDAPASLPAPPSSWAAEYPNFAEEHGLEWKALTDVHAAAAKFLDHALAGSDGSWDHAARAWRTK
jgi:hypothetical protein